MAIVKFYEPTDMATFDWEYAMPSNETYYTGGSIRGLLDEAPWEEVVYRGSFGYSYIENADGTVDLLGLNSGTMTGYEYYRDDVLRVTMSGFSVDAISALEYMELGDKNSNYNQEFMELILSGNDTITGSFFNDSLMGFDGNDTIDGGRRQDNLQGNAGNDILNGEFGVDTLIGGAGDDKLSGGAGSDHFVYNNAKEGGDTITDFSSFAPGNNDNLLFNGGAFGGLAVGAIASGLFQSSKGATARDADVRFIFSSNTGTLYFDADGNGNGNDAVAIATFAIGSTVNASDIFII